MLALLNWRLWAAVGLLALFPLLYMKGRHDGGKLVRAEWAEAKESAAEAVRLRERGMQASVDAAERNRTTRAVGGTRDAASAAGALDELRNAYATRDLAEESAAAATQRADTAGKLLVRSGEVLTQLAARCDRHVNDLQTLLEAWPR